MKRLLLFLVFISTAATAQIISIPDNNFKARLLAADVSNVIAYGNGNYMKIDANSDGEIELIEAQAVDSLNVYDAQIANLSGISGFTNLKKLDCSHNELNVLDVSALTALKILRCSGNNLITLDLANNVLLEELMFDYNNITNIVLTGLTNLKYLSSSSNPLTGLNLAPVPNLEWLYCAYNGLTTLDVSGLTHLLGLACYTNELTALDVSAAPNLVMLHCSENNLTSLNITGLSLLQSLDCSQNALTTLDLNNMVNMRDLRCQQNQLGSINLSDCTLLYALNAGMNQMTALDVSGLQQLYTVHVGTIPGAGTLATLNADGCSSLRFLYANDNALTELTLSGCTHLLEVNVPGNQLTTLDLSDSQTLGSVQVSDNQLVNLLIKNGSNENYVTFANNPDLAFICADESQVAALQQKLLQNNLPDAVVNSYCDFTPGGIYNTVTGTLRLDTDNNGCTAADTSIGNQRITIDALPTPGAAFTSAAGNYTFFVQVPDLTLTPVLENAAYFNITPLTSVLNFPVIDGSTQTVDFCVSANGIHPDVEVIIAPNLPARPGFDASYTILYRNKGNQKVSGQIAFGYSDNILDLVSSVPTPDSQSAGSLTYDYNDLMPFESRSIQVVLNVNSPTETPAVNINDMLTFTTNITANVSPDETPGDNSVTFNQTVVGSYDPNDKQCLEGKTVNPSEIGKYLHYVINFENTGTAAAENIVVKDVIDITKFDLASLQVLSTSHPAVTRIAGDKVEFIFEGVNLGAGQHGNVLFKIKTKNTLTANAVVSNKADIFFDYNFPVTTDPATTTFQVLGTDHFTVDATIRIYPNPAGDFVNVKANEPITSIQLFDVQGRIVRSAIVGDKEAKIDLSQFAPGIYYLKVSKGKGMKTEKLIKK